jgi:hypothetical protein
MSRRSKRTDPKSDKPERGRPVRRQLAPLPEVMFARRPQSAPAPASTSTLEPEAETPAAKPEEPSGPVKRAARIVTGPVAVDEVERERRHLLSRVLDSVTPGAVTRAANAYRKAGFSFPAEQPVQLKLLEHADEAVVCSALEELAALLDEQAPIMLPVFEQRLKRLEEGAENADTRARAAELRRVLRT